MKSSSCVQNYMNKTISVMVFIFVVFFIFYSSMNTRCGTPFTFQMHMQKFLHKSMKYGKYKSNVSSVERAQVLGIRTFIHLIQIIVMYLVLA